jgi:hypothetical protein
MSSNSYVLAKPHYNLNLIALKFSSVEKISSSIFLVEFLIIVVEIIKKKIIIDNKNFFTIDFQSFLFLLNFEIYQICLFQNHKSYLFLLHI